MKKLLFLLVIGSLGTIHLVSQSTTKSADYGWKLITVGTEQVLNKVHFANSQTGYIAGNEGLIMKSSNGGENWTPRVLPSLSHFMCVDATSPEDVYIGAWDTVYTTHNGGASWMGIPTLATNLVVNDIQFLNPSVGVSVQSFSTCYKTTDGGESWNYKGSVGAIEDFYGCHFLNENYGFAVGDCGLIAKTIDGGEFWDIYRWDDYVNWSCLMIYDVHFTSAAKGFAVADSGYLLRTNDAGANWSKTILAEETVKLKSICFVNSNTGYIAGSFGRIYKTTDGGENWFQEFVPTENHLNSVYFVSDTLGFAVGEQGTILKYCNLNASGIGSEGRIADGQVTVYPNPSRQAITVELNLTESSVVKVDLLQLNGQLVNTLSNKMIQPGKQSMQFSLDRIPKGSYLCCITASNWQKRIKIMVL